ncbi:TPA: hypothetical protein ACMU98_002452 [Clostridioides difficile]
MGFSRSINKKCPVINEIVSFCCIYETTPITSEAKFMGADCDKSHICKSSEEDCPILKKVRKL